MTMKSTEMEYSHRKLRAAIRRCGISLNNYSDAGFISLGEKITSGQATGVKALKVYLIGKGRHSKAYTVPQSLWLESGKNGAKIRLTTDVINIESVPCAFGLQSGDKLRAFDGEVGLCGLGFVKAGIGYAITNAHVIRRMEAGGTTGPIDWFDPLTGWRNDIAEPVFASQISYSAPNQEDVAVIRLGSPALVDQYSANSGRVKFHKMDFIRPISGEYWYLTPGDALNQCASPEPIDVPSSVIVDDRIAEYQNFWSLRLTKGHINHGMSGALLCRTTNGINYACGLIFGGIENRFVFAFSFEPLFKRVWNSLPS